MNGQVVRAVGGRRDEYRPVVSRLTTSTEPSEVARALLAATGAGELYIADLDAITGADRTGRAVAALAERCTCRLFVDVGVRTDSSFALVPGAANVVPVLGCETLVGPNVALAAETEFGPNWAFSLDLFRGRLLGYRASWVDRGVFSDADVLEMAVAARNLGAGAFILIDLANVGTGSGAGTEFWCRQIRRTMPDVELIAGGGVRTWEDVERLGAAGADAVLVASALHDGTLHSHPKQTERP
ncbi:MAG: hisA/hisF family protein, partial [Planctomycetes bacterium]|nr:hisA/hisF family protein [Planctomycetota bacterium]